MSIVVELLPFVIAVIIIGGVLFGIDSSLVKVKDLDGKMWRLELKYFYQKIISCTDSNQKIFCHPNEVLKVLEKNADMNEGNKNAIKGAVLDNYSNILNFGDYRELVYEDEFAAIESIFNTLVGEEENSSKKKFIQSVIFSISTHYYEVPLNICKEYNKVRYDWCAKKYDDCGNMQRLNMRAFINELEESFDHTIALKTSEGSFLEDKNRLKSIVDSNYPSISAKFKI